MSNTIKKRFKFIDLFAGIGGFHQAMNRLGGRCVYACEKNPLCREVYNNNYNKDEHIIMHDDICTSTPLKIPKFDVLCAGFPCQPFSKAGHQKGFEDEGRGDLFYKILPIIDAHPEMKFIIMENVRNLADNEANWDVIKNELMARDFIITEEPIILSPHQFGIPQIRERVYIMGIRNNFKDTKTLTNGYIHITDLKLESEMQECPDNSLGLILDGNIPQKYYLQDDLHQLINQWNEFKLGTDIGVIGKPIWLDSFGIGEDNTEEFYRRLDYYGVKSDKDGNSILDKEGKPALKYPMWKRAFVDFNRKFYLEHRGFVDEWIARNHIMEDDNKLHRKFEWNCGEHCHAITECIIQIRQSGIRVKRPNFFPSLVAMDNTPIVWDAEQNNYRYIMPHEAAKLQSFDENIEFLDNDKETYKQLGNSVNVNLIEILAKKLFKLGKWRKTNGKKD